MKEKIPVLLKAAILKNAQNRCEYCKIQDKLFYYSFHIDHITSLKHFGKSILDNLAYSCPDCNFNKGSDLGTLNNQGEIVRFFNPRIDFWDEHFAIKEGKNRVWRSNSKNI